MKFYDRKREIEMLQEIEELSSEYAQMTMMVGRRRIGKTTLLKNAFMKTPVFYFFVGRKNEVLLCEEFVNEVEMKLNEARINLHILENKAVAIAQQYANYQIEYRGFSLKDM